MSQPTHRRVRSRPLPAQLEEARPERDRLGRDPDHPLSDGDVMCLHYMMDIETHTVIYLRDLLATRAAVDPQITAFLSLLGL